MKDFSKFNCNPLNTKELSEINGGDVSTAFASWVLGVGKYFANQPVPWYLYEK